ncbi:hypothetical protein CYMTET_43466 [Cymbomonas tetramitiformis]|uniref:Uncharacterized protein n=1 Tax=Cymbomonas tetramitiformis TaxID=36881 RepID=A0AAE0EZY2_9CHLO|nr:hypothetical protein CYMTET_43466 [Cymbomonas tetramitiformis]
MLKRIFQKLDFVESYIKLELKKKNNNGTLSTAAVTTDTKRKRGGLKGYRSGLPAQPVVGFEASTRRAKPLCPRCPAAVLHGDRGPAGGIDLSAYGFAVTRTHRRNPSDDSDDSDDEKLEEIRDLKSRRRQREQRAAVHSPLAAAAVSLPHAHVPSLVVPQPPGLLDAAWIRGANGVTVSTTFRTIIRTWFLSAFASYVPTWLLASTLLLCATAVRALQASSGFQPSGAYPPAGFHTEWGMPLGRTRERFVAGGASHFPNPPYDSPPPPTLDYLADLFTVALEQSILAAYQQGVLAALRLRDSPEAVPVAGDTAAGDALRTVVPPSGGEITS